MIYSKSIRTVAASLMSAATLAVMLTPMAAHASIFSHKKDAGTGVSAKVQTVHFSMRNQSGDDIDLKVGDNTMSVAKGKTISLNLPVGTRIVTTAASSKREAGALVCEVSTVLANNTVVLN